MSETTCKTIHVAQPAAPQTIPGYELLEKIGSGGYGEVWRALAPGAVKKAVKIVYGNVDESRGATELKSLERIKDARHPFLLVLERYDVVEGRLIVVTELADGSLKDRFDECRAEGKPGIPRQELLEYLRDAADALDYMDDKHGLAHLDIKPENILLVGGRAKVADFGLTKDLRVENLSLMSGLTPLFAGPELFEGRACRQSDQYSLAIVYQILLTGQSPFNGRTAAQLTAQHLHSTPSLSGLPPSDRGTIARALSKKPPQRFETCRAMVDQLLDRSTQRHAPEKPSRPGTRRERTSSVEDVPAQIAARFGTAPAPATRDRFRPAVEPVITSPARPVIVVALGGIGARVLRALDERPALRGRTALRMLYVDTDAHDVNEVLRERRSRPPQASFDDADADGDTPLVPLRPADPIAAVALPLRSAAEYRYDATRWLEWIDRRWLYNVPRSLRTEGIRALGRLAFVDRETRVADTFAATLSTVLDEWSFDAADGAAPATPLVYVVGSSSGGTGGGAAIDFARLARRSAALAGVEIDVRGVFVHAKRQNTVNGELADANTLALLAELRHDLAAGRADTGTTGTTHLGFSQALLVDSGDGVCDDDVLRALHTTVAFLERVVTSPVGELLVRDDAETSADVPTIGSVGFAPVHGLSAERTAELARRLEHDMLGVWNAAVATDRSASFATLADELLERCDLAPERFAAEFAQLVQGEASRQFARGVETLAVARGVDENPSAATIVSLSEQVVNEAGTATLHDESHPAFLLDVIGRDRRRKGDRLVVEVSKLLAERMNGTGLRFGEPRALFEAVRTLLEQVGGTLDGVIRDAESTLDETRGRLTRPSESEETCTAEAYAIARFRLAVATIFVETTGELLGRLTEIGDSINSPQSTLRAGRENGAVGGEPVGERLTAELDRRFDRALDEHRMDFGTACTRHPEAVRELLSREANRLATECVLNGTLRAAGDAGRTDLVNRTFAAAQPRLRIKGTTRLVLTVPTASVGPLLSPPADRGITPVVEVAPDAEPGVLWITTGIPFAHVAERFVAERPAVLQLADRLHTRNDVDWKPITRGQ